MRQSSQRTSLPDNKPNNTVENETNFSTKTVSCIHKLNFHGIFQKFEYTTRKAPNIRPLDSLALRILPRRDRLAVDGDDSPMENDCDRDIGGEVAPNSNVLCMSGGSFIDGCCDGGRGLLWFLCEGGANSGRAKEQLRAKLEG